MGWREMEGRRRDEEAIFRRWWDDEVGFARIVACIQDLGFVCMYSLCNQVDGVYKGCLLVGDGFQVLN